MERLTLSTPLYQEFYAAGDLLIQEIARDPKGKWAEKYTEFTDLQEAMTGFFGVMQPDEKHSRAIHFLLCEYDGGFIRDKKKCSIPTPLLEQVRIMGYRILGTNIDLSVNIQELKTGKKYAISREYMGSERSLLDLKQGTLVLSHMRQVGDDIESMKNFLYIEMSDEIRRQELWYAITLGETRSLEHFAEIFAEMLSGLHDIPLPSQRQNTNGPDINYEKRLKKLCEQYLGRKFSFSSVEKYMSSEIRSFEDFQQHFFSKVSLPQTDLRKLEENYIGYLDDLDQKRREKKAGDQSRIQFVLFAFRQQQVTQNEKKEKSLNINLLWQTWLQQENIYLNMRTPFDFIRETNPDFTIDQIRHSMRHEDDLEFYDIYSGEFSQEEHEQYYAMIESSKSGDYQKAITTGEGLLGKHGEFFRLRYGLLSARINKLVDKYHQIQSSPKKRFLTSQEILQEEFDFLESVDTELGSIKVIAPQGYLPLTPDKVVGMRKTVEVLKDIIGMYLVEEKTLTHKKEKNTKKQETPPLPSGGSGQSVYQLKLQLKHFKPSNYRTILIATDETFFDLHCRIQDLFGWTDSHLWNFTYFNRNTIPSTDTTYEVKKCVQSEGGKVYEASKYPISHFFGEYQKILYTYDFGDNWEIDITLEKEVEMTENLPKYLRGKGGKIPEDIGGVWGLEEYYESYAKKEAPEDWEYHWWYEDESNDEDEKDGENLDPLSLWESFKEYMEEEVFPVYVFEEWTDPKQVGKEYQSRIKQGFYS